MNSSMPVIFALLTGLFWGTYGPVLGQARAFEKSAFKPYVMIGVAYLVWGIIGGLVGMAYTQKPGEPFFNFAPKGIAWGFAAGTLGAWGALTLTLAMFTGGTAMPQIVMPIVFGTAVSVSAIVAVLTTKTETNPMLYLGIIGMAICIVIVAYFTPHPHPPKPATSAPAVEAKA
jgi:peptidoglycan/LPS O-acetylase OafA/YrhL